MTSPSWLAAVLAPAMLLIAVGSAARLAIWRHGSPAGQPESDALHVLMGVAMAGMLEPGISPLPGVAWQAVFAAAAAWFAWRAVRIRARKRQAEPGRASPSSWRHGHPAPHVVECAAMIYMLVPAATHDNGPATAMPGMNGATPTANPAIALVLALFMLGYIMWTADRLASQTRGRAAGQAPSGSALAPRTAALSNIAMSVAMGYMLLTML